MCHVRLETEIFLSYNNTSKQERKVRKMRIVDFQERLERVDPLIKLRVETMLKYLYEDCENFEEMTGILDTIEDIVQEQIKKVDTNKLK